MSILITRARTYAAKPSSSARLHAAVAVTMGAVLMVEPPGGYQFPVWDGPRAALFFAPNPLAAWGVIFACLGVAAAVARGRTAPLVVLTLLSGAWGVFASSALYVGLTDDRAASAFGVVLAALAVDASRAALAFPRFHPALILTPGVRAAMRADRDDDDQATQR